MVDVEAGGENNNSDFGRLIAAQTASIERLAAHFAPEKIEEQESKKFKKLGRLFMKSGSLIALSITGIFGAWEFTIYLKDTWEIRRSASNYADVAVRLYYDENNTTVSKEFISKALKLNPDNAEYLYLDSYIDGMSEVRLLFNLDRPYTASELDASHRAIAKAILLEQQDPSKPEAFILRGQIYTALKDYTRAIEALDRAIEISPDNDFAIMRLGVTKYLQGDSDLAIELFNQSLKFNPSSKWAFLWKGIVFSDLRKLNEARTNLELAVAIDPRFDLALYNLGWLELKGKKKDYGLAEEYFRKALSVNPSYKEAFYGLGMVYGYQKEYEIAHQFLNKALELDKQFLTAWKWRGIVSYEMKKYADAVSDFSTGLKLDPTNADLFVRRARVAILTEQYAKALPDLLLGKKFDNSNPRTFLYLGQVYYNLGQLKPATDSISAALNLNPSYPEAHAAMGKIFNQKGDISEAIQSLQKAYDLSRYRRERFALPLTKLLRDNDQQVVAFKILKSLFDEGNRDLDVLVSAFYTSRDLNKFSMSRVILDEYIRVAPNSDKIGGMKAALNK
jgi:tetratricopeptide (TPR) repeat protein